MESLSKYIVPTEELRWNCETEIDCIKSTDDADSAGEIVGQGRAIDAIRLGLHVNQPGYNVFVVGYSGTGRTTTIKRLLEELDEEPGKIPDDLCYVNNFSNTDQPRLLKFPAGEGAKFRDEMKNAIDQLKESIPGLMESDELRAKRKEIIEEFEEKQKELIREFEKEVKERDFAMTQVQVGQAMRPDVNPVIGGKPTPLSELEAKTEAGEFPRERYDQIKETYDELAEEMVQIFKQTRENQKELNDKLEQLHKDAISPVVLEIINGVRYGFEAEELDEYLTEVQESIIKNRENFQQRQDTGENRQPGMPGRPQQDPFYEYSVNLLVDSSKLEKRPTITEVNPNFKNIFGSIERMIDRQGYWRTDFTRLKPGALHRANGGFLVLDAFDTLIEPGVWQGLKRTLRSGKLEIQAYDPVFLYSSSAMKPQPVDIDLKVILIGMPEIYYLLYKLDPIFTKIFKVKADFDTVMDHNDTNLANYNQIARRMVEDHNLLPFDRDGVGALIEYGVRLAGRKNKLSTRFNLIADIMREADHWARKDNSESVKEPHVDRAIDEWIRRVSLIEDKIDELIEQNTLLIDTEGKVVGQINGLSVYNLGEYMFGKPTRITARTSVGSKGIINIEKEAQLSGSTHSKGVMIISGYLQSKFAQNRPLSMNAHLCFEQSYGGVDGDSASSTEIYAILSSLAEVPIRQDIAVTGSVNQLGRVQAIGGVNQKVEGFFKICREKGFTGEQGVMIPKSNVPELMLRKEVVQAVKDGKFNIYAVDTIDEGVEILMGMKAGEQKKGGSYPKNTLFHLVEQKLEQYAQTYKRYSSGHSD